MFKMSSLIFINGPNGVGKSSVCKVIHQRLSHAALLESEWCRMINPFILDKDTTISLTIDNITLMLRNYLSSTWIEYVIFPYGFHGARQFIWDSVMNNLQDISYNFIPITLTCAEKVNILRMKQDGRGQDRIQRALDVRHLYENLEFPKIDTTNLSVDETADQILEVVQRTNNKFTFTASDFG